MHVAICDDNVADRKHLERLLSRESDKRAGTTNILYIDSYGDKDYFLKNQTPLKYNIIFMAMCALIPELGDGDGKTAGTFWLTSLAEQAASGSVRDTVFRG